MPKRVKLPPKIAGFVHDIVSMEGATLRAMQGVFATTQREIARDLTRWIARGPIDGKYGAARLLQAQRMLGIAQGQVGGTKALNSLGSRIANLMGRADPVRLGASQAMDQLAALSAEFRGLPLPRIKEAAGFLDRATPLAADRFKPSLKRYNEEVRQDMRQQLAIGMVKGETVRETTRRLSRLSGFRSSIDASTPPHVMAKLSAEGLAKRYENSANRLVRTELLSSYNASALGVMRTAAATDPRVIAVWDASLDNRLCPICAGLHGKTARPGEEFPGGYIHPPAHPHCRCALVTEYSPDKSDDDLFLQELPEFID